MAHRTGWAMKDEKTREDFIKLAKSKNIYFPIPEKKKRQKDYLFSNLDVNSKIKIFSWSFFLYFKTSQVFK